MQHFKAFIFDMDGLLLDTERLALDAFLLTCQRLNLPDLQFVFYKIVGTNAQLAQSILKQGLTGLADVQQFSRIWDTEYNRLTHIQPIPLKLGVNELLEKINAIGAPMAVATSTQTASAENKLTQAGIFEYFEFVMGGDQVKNSKPAADMYLQAAEKLNRHADECLAFEDSANGVKSAIAAGMTVVQIPDLVKPDAELLALGPIVLNSLYEVLNYDFKKLEVRS